MLSEVNGNTKGTFYSLRLEAIENLLGEPRYFSDHDLIIIFDKSVVY